MILFSRILGQGPHLIILHGLYGSGDNWFNIARKLESRFTVHLVDARNHGRSPHHPEHNYTVMVDDLKEYFLKHKIQRASVLGHSMGGKTAMLFAIKNPEFVSNLIVADIMPLGYTGNFNLGQESFHGKIFSTMLEIELDKIKTRDEVEELFIQKTQNKILSSFLMKNLKFEDNKWSWKINVESLNKNLHRMMMGIDDELGYLPSDITGFPVLFIKGEKSDYIPSNSFPFIFKIFPGAAIEEIKDASHWLHAEYPDEFVKILLHFIFS